jgi:hypothetical protein
MNEIVKNNVQKEKWVSPTIFSLSAKSTDSGGSPAQPEDSINSPEGSL